MRGSPGARRWASPYFLRGSQSANAGEIARSRPGEAGVRGIMGESRMRWWGGRGLRVSRGYGRAGESFCRSRSGTCVHERRFIPP
ncbi:MAG: hypothetical protein RLZZ142_2592 [Verrucomicrobiota bacterium]